MPVRNEEEYLRQAVAALQAQDYPRDRLEILVVDGGSTDRSRSVVEELARSDPRIRLLGGEGVNCPAAMNVGIRAARGELVAKIDGHGYVGPGYFAVAVRHLQANAELGCVGGVVEPVPAGQAAECLAAARFSRFGVGGGLYGTEHASPHLTPTVQCGVYRKAAVQEVGGFDEALQFGEDEELNWRLLRTGKKILLDPEIRFHYFPRAGLRQLFRQYYAYGEARVRVLRKDPGFLRLRHLAPAAMVAATAAGAVFGLLAGSVPLAVVVPAFYLAFVAAGAATIARARRLRAPHLVAGGLICLHWGYGLGMWTGAVRSVLPRRPAGVGPLAG
jgi:GT2 family glycosyltransferase